MTIAHDSVYTESVMTGTDDPHNISHTPGATLSGVWLTAAHGVDSTDHITKVTYGGIPMRRIDTTFDVSTELGRSYLYFLGHDIPTGNQTVAVDTDATTTDIQFVVGGFTGATDIELVDVAITQDQVTNPSLTMEVGGRTSATVGVIYSGLADVTNLTINGNMTAIHDHDFGNFVSRVDKQTTPSSSDFTYSYTAGVDDTALVVAAFSEVVTPGIEHAAIITSATRTDTSDPYDFTHTPLETLQGVWVMAFHEVSSADHITGITYGGQAMTRVQTNVDTSGEPARTYIYFLGTGIPTGAQTVSVDNDATGDDIRFYCGGFLAGTDTEIVDNDGVSEQGTSPSITLTTVSGRRAASIGVIYSGLGNFGSAVLDPGMTVILGTQITQGVLAFVLDPVPDASNFTVAFTSGVSDDIALSGAMFAEEQAPQAATTVHAVTTVGAPTLPRFPATVAAVATLAAPTTAFGSVLTVTTVQAVGTVGVPVVTAEGGSVLITPVRVAAVATVGSPTVDTPVVITPVRVLATAHGRHSIHPARPLNHPGVRDSRGSPHRHRTAGGSHLQPRRTDLLRHPHRRPDRLGRHHRLPLRQRPSHRWRGHRRRHIARPVERRIQRAGANLGGVRLLHHPRRPHLRAGQPGRPGPNGHVRARHRRHLLHPRARRRRRTRRVGRLV